MRLVFDQSSPVHPVSEPPGFPTSMTERRRRRTGSVFNWIFIGKKLGLHIAKKFIIFMIPRRSPRSSHRSSRRRSPRRRTSLSTSPRSSPPLLLPLLAEPGLLSSSVICQAARSSLVMKVASCLQSRKLM